MTAKQQSVKVALSPTSLRLLDELASHGLYGVSREDVAARLVDKGLQAFVPMPLLSSGPDYNRTREEHGLPRRGGSH